jgi:hypothetical protein
MHAYSLAMRVFFPFFPFARLIGKSGFTVREWARYHRIQAAKWSVSQIAS